MNEKEFTITIPHTYTYKEGWGVLVIPIYTGEDGDELTPIDYPSPISDIDVEVVKITEKRAKVVGGVACVESPNGVIVPLSAFLDVPDLWEDDTHDLRSRWFSTEIEARSWAAHVEDTWKFPEPYKKFVRVV